jgi:hypothetical protein
VYIEAVLLTFCSRPTATMTRPRAGQSRSCVLIPEKETFLFFRASRSALKLTQPPMSLVRELKPPGREAEHLPPSSAEVKMSGAIHPFSYMPSWGAQDNFYLGQGIGRSQRRIQTSRCAFLPRMGY